MLLASTIQCQMLDSSKDTANRGRCIRDVRGIQRLDIWGLSPIGLAGRAGEDLQLPLFSKVKAKNRQRGQISQLQLLEYHCNSCKGISPSSRPSTSKRKHRGTVTLS